MCDIVAWRRTLPALPGLSPCVTVADMGRWALPNGAELLLADDRAHWRRSDVVVGVAERGMTYPKSRSTLAAFRPIIFGRRSPRRLCRRSNNMDTTTLTTAETWRGPESTSRWHRESTGRVLLYEQGGKVTLQTRLSVSQGWSTVGIVLDAESFRDMFNVMALANPDLMRALCARAMAPGRLLSPTFGHPEAIQWANTFDILDPLTEAIPEDHWEDEDVDDEFLPLLTLVPDNE
jgi:hypothetical protein